MPKPLPGYVQYVLADVLGHLPGITYKRMFGGFGLYQHGVIFALIAQDELYFKASDITQADFQAYDSHPFTYQKASGQQAVMSYWKVPEEILEAREEIGIWVAKAIDVSLSKQKS